MGMLRMHARVSATHNPLTFCCLSCAEVSKPIDFQEPKRKRKRADAKLVEDAKQATALGTYQDFHIWAQMHILFTP
jgi:hypothetical protein